MEADAVHPDAASASAEHLRLTPAVIVAAAALFVTLLALFTGRIETLWPLYLVPVIAASITYGLPGAALSTVLCAGIVALMLPSADLPVGPRATMIVGFVAFLLSGVAVGIQFARNRELVRGLERASVVDPETGLLKPEALRERLAQEITRADRHDVEVTLAVVHIDDLEAFRSTFGSYKAGLLLEHMGDVVRIAVRGTDIVGRWAHDSFAVVAPFAGPVAADIIAGRISRAVREARFEGDVLQPAAQCDVTVVHASTPREATGFDALVDLLEERLSSARVESPVGIDGAPSPEASANVGV